MVNIAKVNSKIDFIRFNGAPESGTVKKIDRTGKRGAWLRVKVEGRKNPVGVRFGQITRVNGTPVL